MYLKGWVDGEKNKIFIIYKSKSTDLSKIIYILKDNFIICRFLNNKDIF